MKLPITIASTALTVSMLFALPSASADTLIIPLGQQAGSTAAALPERGLSTTGVAQRYGEPARRHAAVGQPPISRWDYTDFSVYFERDKVVHSVRQHRRQGN